MAEERVQRRLAAILAADVAGYSRLVGLDEEGTLATLRAHRREIADPTVERHNGRIVKTTGDGALIEFASVIDAVRCAIELQRLMADRNAEVPSQKRIEFRIGINVGDIVIEGNDILGDGVNIAARLEGLAQPGGILVSRAVHDQVQDRLDATFEDIGECELKNITRPVRVYRVLAAETSTASPARRETLPLPAKPSIAVLPFVNIGGDVEQEYFADGIVEEITMALSRMHWLFVIARNSSFTYKGRTVDVKQVGRELGVRYVLEGSVRKAGAKVRITGQLIDTTTRAHLWADRFEGALGSIFDLQDQVTASVVGALSPKLEQAEIERAKRKGTENLDAYDYYLRGLAAFYQWSRPANMQAISLFGLAIERDPEFASAYAMAAQCYGQRLVNGWVVDREQEKAETARLARQAAALGKDDAFALCGAGFCLAVFVGDFDDGAALIEQALSLNPNLAIAWSNSGWLKVYLGDSEAAIERIARAMRLSPHDPYMCGMQTASACAHFIAGRYAEAMAWAEAAVREKPNFGPGLRALAASSAMNERLEQAQKAISRLRALYPTSRIAETKELFPARRMDDLVRWQSALRKAGLPD